MILKPQKGPQEKFLATKADIAIYGGAAGGGKTYALLLEPLRHMNVEGYSATIFRKNATQINIDGGLLDESRGIYGLLKNAVYKASPKPHWVFNKKAKVSFMHIDGDKDLPKWQGSQICCTLDTLVLMADGTYKRVGNLKVGDTVMTLEGAQKITVACKPILRDCVRVELPNGETQIQSSNHSILTKSGWVSCDDLLSSRPMSNYSIRESCERKHNLRLICHKALAKKSNRQAHTERLFELFQGLNQSVLARYVYRKLCESPRLLIYAPMISRFFCKFVRRYGQTPPLFGQYPCNHSVHLPQALTRFLSIPGHQCLPANDGHKAWSIRDNVSEEFRHTLQFAARHTLYHLLEEVLILYQQSAYHAFSSVAIPDEEPDEMILSLTSDYPANYQVCPHLYGEQLHSNEDNAEVYVQVPDGVVVQSRTDLHFCEKDKVPTNNLRILRYNHPYTGQQRTAEVDYSYQTLKITPCGKKFVRNICVASSNHYITKCGLVNKNCFLGFDELTHFNENQFFYMLSRNRSTCGVAPYVRATCNPDCDSWVAKFIEWWIDQNTGYAIPERDGVVRAFYRSGDGRIMWGNSKQEVCKKVNAVAADKIAPKDCKTATFISASVYDNEVLLKANPEYLSSLKALSLVEKERLLRGNWKIRPAAGLYFPREKVSIVRSIPGKISAICRAWDLAATEITAENKNPDRTAGVLCARLDTGQYIILDVKRKAFNAADVRNLVKSTAITDRELYRCTNIRIPQDPGQAGKEQAQSYISHLAGFNVECKTVSGSKITRADPLSAQWQAGNILLLAGDWNEDFVNELEGFPDALHDDQVDAAADAFSAVTFIRDWGWV